MEYLKRIKKLKKRQFFVISANGPHNGLETLHLETHHDQWQILHAQRVQYPKQIETALQRILSEQRAPVSAAEIATLDYAMSHFLAQHAQSSINALPKSKRNPHLIIVQELLLWHGMANPNNQPRHWAISCGDMQLVADKTRVPVLTDFIRQNILTQDLSTLPTLTGDLRIAKKRGHIVALLHLGRNFRISIIDTLNFKILLDSDAGPGTNLIDMAAYQAGCDQGFDRDGSTALSGTVNTAVLEELLGLEWFRLPAPKIVGQEILDACLHHQSLQLLNTESRLATLTALAACSITNCYKREYNLTKPADALILTGGGVNNLACMAFLRGYFAPQQLMTCEEIDIPPANKTCLSFALTMSTLLDDEKIEVEKGVAPLLNSFGRWITPQ